VNPVSEWGGHVKPGHYVDILVACKETPNSEDVTGGDVTPECLGAGNRPGT